MTFLRSERRFVLAMNRFCWEQGRDASGVYERVNTGLCFENVTRAELRGFSQAEHDFILDLLTVTFEGSHVTLSFAGYRDVRLTIDGALDCRLDDFGQPWPTKTCPKHSQGDDWTAWDDNEVTSQT
jgi:hypothetical protein